MKIKELREKSADELKALRAELKHEALTLRIQQRGGQLENPARLTLIRKDIARIETLLSGQRNAVAK